jgi:OOP family OmpA-OmpF porin
VRRTSPRRGFRTPFLTALALTLGLAVVPTRLARAAACSSPAGLSPCFDGNALWLPAGSPKFSILPDTRATAVRRPSFALASEVLHHPVLLHAASPDPSGRDVRVLDFALDTTLLASAGVFQDLELSLAAPLRVYQTGAGVAGVTSQSAPPIERTALRDPRIGVAYSLDDALGARGMGLRLSLDASLPLGDERVFAGERSFVAVPSATFGYQRAALRVSASLGVRLRRAVDFGGVRLGNQGVLALGAGLELLDPGLLFISLEAFASPPLSDNRAPSAAPPVSSVTVFPAEWLLGLHSSLGTTHWSLTLAGGGGIPLSRETHDTAAGASTSHFLGVTTPDFRGLLVARYTLDLAR